MKFKSSICLVQHFFSSVIASAAAHLHQRIIPKFALCSFQNTVNKDVCTFMSLLLIHKWLCIALILLLLQQLTTIETATDHNKPELNGKQIVETTKANPHTHTPR